MSKRTLVYSAWIAILVLAAYLRLHDLGERPMHADEATGARIAARQLETAEYTFNPVHFHGPTLSYATRATSSITGERSWKDMSATSLRQVTALFGWLTVLVPLLWVRFVGQGPAIASAAFLATSPLLVYYSRMYIHESLLTFFGVTTIVMTTIAWIEQKRKYWVLAAVCLGLMLATKETFAISMIAWGLAIALAVVILRHQFNLQSIGRERLKIPLSWLVPGAALVVFFLYTDGFRNPGGIVDFVRTFFVYETVSGHDKPFSYYLHLLILPKGNLKLFWWEGGIAILAGLTLITAYWKRGASTRPEQGFLIPFFAGSIVFHILIYSMIGYKTPWLMLLPWAQACLLAGMVFREFNAFSGRCKVCLIALTGLVLAIQLWQCFAVTGRFANDQRNPYAYVPTSGDVPRLAEWLAKLETVAPGKSLEPVGVLGSYYWPLPWYLRDFDSIGYWNAMEQRINDLAVVLVMPDQFAQAESGLSGTHVALPRGLRQDTPMMLYIKRGIWERWMEKEE